MTFKLPRRSELPHLSQSPLRLAILQVRYGALLAVEQAGRVAAFEEALGSDFEFVNREVAQLIRVYVGDTGLEPPHPSPSDSVWRFKHVTNDWHIVLSASSLGFEANSYWDYNDLSSSFRSVLAAFADVFTPSRQLRVGMRYINEITDSRILDPANLPIFVARDLLRPVGTALGYDLISSLSDLRFEEPAGVVVIRHGLVKNDTYLLDIDHFSEIEATFNADTIHETLDGFHATVESLFVWALTKDYLDELRRS